jgi:hypothetical protein
MELANAAHPRAEMMRFEVHGHSVWGHHPCQLIGDLVGHFLLDAETARNDAHEASQLADPDDVFVGDVADPGLAVERWA